MNAARLPVMPPTARVTGWTPTAHAQYLPLVILCLVKVVATFKECSGVIFSWWLEAFNLHGGGRRGEEGRREATQLAVYIS